MQLTDWRKQWRKVWDNPSLRGRPNHMLVWMWILDHAMWKDGEEVRFDNKIIKLKKGQVTCGSLQISIETGCSPSTISRVIRDLASESLLERLVDARCSLITVKNWATYQGGERLSDSQMVLKRVADESQMRTKEEVKKLITKETKNLSVAEATPSETARDFFENEPQQEKLVVLLADGGQQEEKCRAEIKKFVSYWTEPNSTGRKLRWQMQPTFDVKRRLTTWFSRSRDFTSSTISKIPSI